MDAILAAPYLRAAAAFGAVAWPMALYRCLPTFFPTEFILMKQDSLFSYAIPGSHRKAQTTHADIRTVSQLRQAQRFKAICRTNTNSQMAELVRSPRRLEALNVVRQGSVGSDELPVRPIT